MQVSKIGLRSSCGSVGINNNKQQNQSIPVSNQQISMKGKIGKFFAECLKNWTEVIKKNPWFQFY